MTASIGARESSLPIKSNHPISFSTEPEPLVFNRILHFYVPPPARIIDPMCGYRKFYQMVSGNLTGSDYDIMTGDKRRLEGFDLMNQTWIGDATTLPLRNETADAIIYDPPFSDAHAMEWRYGERSAENLKLYLGTKTIQELHELHAKMNPEFERVLKPKGWLIAKTYDRHIDHVLHLEHSCMLQFFPNFILRDMMVYRIHKPLGRILNPAFGKFHAYFLVLQKR